MLPSKVNSFEIDENFKIKNKSEQLYKCGVYAIVNTVNNKMYIGSTTQYFIHRLNLHLYELKNKKHCNSYLQNSVYKYGIQKFIILILEEIDNVEDYEVSLENFLSRESYYINLFDSYAPNGYNITKVYGDKKKDIEEVNVRIEKIRQRKIHRQNVQFNKDKSIMQCYGCINYDIETSQCIMGHALEYNVLRCAKNNFDCSDYYEDKNVDIFDLLPIDDITQLYLNGVDICEYEDRLIGGDLYAEL